MVIADARRDVLVFVGMHEGVSELVRCDLKSVLAHQSDRIFLLLAWLRRRAPHDIGAVEPELMGGISEVRGGPRVNVSMDLGDGDRPMRGPGNTPYVEAGGD